MTTREAAPRRESAGGGAALRPSADAPAGAVPAADHRSAVEVHDLRRRYGAFEAVRGVSFEVQPGEVFALLGVNGAGKTSTLEVVEGLAAPDAGSVRILGVDPRTDRAAVRRHLGVLLQASGLPGDLTARETVRMWAGTLTSPRPVDDALAAVELDSRVDVRVRSLSGGERRRLDLALTLLGRPRVLVLDEPTTGLDPESRRTVWSLVEGLAADGVAVLLTTHYLEEAERLADRIAIMRDGQIVLSGTRAEIVGVQPATIRCTVPASAPPLPELPDCVVVSGPPEVLLRTQRLQASLASLLGWASEHGVVLGDLQAGAASLEQAFLAAADGVVAGPVTVEAVQR